MEAINCGLYVSPERQGLNLTPIYLPAPSEILATRCCVYSILFSVFCGHGLLAVLAFYGFSAFNCPAV